MRLAVLGLAAHAGSARAQDVPADPQALAAQREQEAQAQFERGSALYEDQQLSAAIDAFTASYRLAPTANVAFNIAQTCELLGRTEDAFNWYQVSIALPEVEGAARARERSEALLPQVAAIAVSSVPPDAVLDLDGAELATSPLSPRLVAVTPGHHSLSAQRLGFATREAAVDAERGQLVTVTLELEPLRLPPTPTLAVQLPSEPPLVQTPTTAHRRSASASRVTRTGLGDFRWVGYGAAVALLGAGGVLGVAAINKHEDVQADPMHAGKDELTRLNLAADLTVGAALLTAAIVFVLDGPLAGPEREESERADAARSKSDLAR